MGPQILSQWGCGGVEASILMGRFPRWLWRDVVMTYSPAGVKCLPLALGSGQATGTTKQDWKPELSKTGRKGSLFRAVRTQALPPPLQMIIFLRNQILHKKFLAMFTCVSSRGLNFCPNKASVKSLPFGVLENEMCYVLPTNNTLGVLMHSNWCFLRIFSVCVCVFEYLSKLYTLNTISVLAVHSSYVVAITCTVWSVTASATDSLKFHR